MKKIMMIAATSILMLSACNKQVAEQNTNNEPVVIDFPTSSSQSSMANKDDAGEHMMMETVALQQDCQTLTAQSDEQKRAVLVDIAHNMDTDALDKIMGTECAFLGGLEKVADITDDNLKLMPGDQESLYYNPATNHFFVTCMSANTIAYVVEKKDASVSPAAYFEANQSEFVSAATEAKAMMEMMDKENDMGETAMNDHGGWVDQANDPARYSAYVDGVVGNGMESVLFFHANWCPKCQANDKILGGIYEEQGANRSTYKINYDAAGQLRQEFGVTQQDTFILIDGNGNEIDRAVFPTEEKLEELIAVK